MISAPLFSPKHVVGFLMQWLNYNYNNLLVYLKYTYKALTISNVSESIPRQYKEKKESSYLSFIVQNPKTPCQQNERFTFLQ